MKEFPKDVRQVRLGTSNPGSVMRLSLWFRVLVNLRSTDAGTWESALQLRIAGMLCHRDIPCFSALVILRPPVLAVTMCRTCSIADKERTINIRWLLSGRGTESAIF
jgi:hypothetical protein